MRGYGMALVLCILMQTAQAADSSPIYPEILIDDVQHVVTAPARWQDDEWRNFGLASFAVVGTAVLIDRPVRDAMSRHHGDNAFLIQIERFGVQYAAVTVSAFYLAGSALNDEKAVSVAQDAFTASIIASGMITPAIKLLAGRARPYQSNDIYYFKPFSDPNASFPSGHTTEAFALASVIAEHYDETWVTCASYGIATLVGIARSYHAAHYASDILAGAMIGTAVGKSVVAHGRTCLLYTSPSPRD